MNEMNGHDHPGGDPPENHKDGMPMNHHEEMMRSHHEKWLWTTCASITLGLWLLLSPFTFGYDSLALTWSDVISGTLIILFGLAALSLRFDLARWGICATGIWLLFAPLVFWAKTSSAYVNDTLIGSLVIAFSVLAPMMPGKAHHMVMMQPGPVIPPGWSYNPSSWLQRAPAIALAFVGFFISRYLAAYQLGYIPTVWDPFFGDGTRKVLMSEVSRMWPISDAGLGAATYMLEALSGFMGGQSRWRTMPWMVLMFGILVVPLGVTHVVLVIFQPVLVGAWCTLCLLAALVMLLMIPLAVDEVVPMVQFMVRSVREGKPFWRTFWVGGTLEGEEGEDSRTPALTSSVPEVSRAMVWGVSIPWNLALSILVGLWLLFSPALFGVGGNMAKFSQVSGALIITVAVMATAEVIRMFRLLNVLLGLGIIAAPWIVTATTPAFSWNAVLSGIVVIGLSLRRGPVRERYGTWQPYVR